MSLKSKFKTSKEAKKAGWFSRRHQTSKDHLEAKRRRDLKENKRS